MHVYTETRARMHAHAASDWPSRRLNLQDMTIRNSRGRFSRYSVPRESEKGRKKGANEDTDEVIRARGQKEIIAVSPREEGAFFLSMYRHRDNEALPV